MTISYDPPEIRKQAESDKQAETEKQIEQIAVSSNLDQEMSIPEEEKFSLAQLKHIEIEQK